MVRELAGDHTVILISHRLASVVDAHRIYLLGEGRIAEQGTHKELMELGGSYAELYRSQQELEQYGKEGKRMSAKPGRRKGIRIMGALIVLVKPLLPGDDPGSPAGTFPLRGEQYCNHFIAFKLLALIRHKVFAALRRLCPAKLEGKDKGNLISMITTDVELLEVFYAHTLSPIAIAAAVSLFMTVFIGGFSIGAGLLALGAYVTVGAADPSDLRKKRGREGKCQYRIRLGI